MKDYGFVQPILDELHYIAGAFSPIPKIVLEPNGQWDDSIPVYEAQKLEDGEDEDGCSVWGTENAIEFLMKKLNGKDFNYSERYIYNVSNTLPPGNDPHVIAETVRNFGLIDEAMLPITKTLDDFIKPRPMNEVFIKLGKQWLDDYDFKHEWLFVKGMEKESRTERMKEYLLYSPLGISVTAWIMENEVYVDYNEPNNHWCVCFGWNDRGWKVFDSYDQSVKIVSFDHNIQYCKRYFIQKKVNKGYLTYLFEQLYLALKRYGLIQNSI